MLPVLVTVIVAVAGWPAGSTVPGEFGSPLLVTAGGVNEIVPVNGSLRCAPSTGAEITTDTVHRPGAGVRWKNCMVRARADRVVGGRLQVEATRRRARRAFPSST